MTIKLPHSKIFRKVLCVKGQKAKSDFKILQLLNDIRDQVPELRQLRCHYIYFVELSSPLAEVDALRFYSLLEGEPVHVTELFRDQSVVVAPRIGTISAWCSKAMDILHRCGLSSIKRIERGIEWQPELSQPLSGDRLSALQLSLHDRMVESILNDPDEVKRIFKSESPRALQYIDCTNLGLQALKSANSSLGLAMSETELQYVQKWYESQIRDPTDAELMMFSQVNSEHCRHKIFNASWKFDGQSESQSMFSMIRQTHQASSHKALIAYADNAAVIANTSKSASVVPGQADHKYISKREPLEIVFKAETHNHPTAISPFPGAATGSGGEIRDEGATGRGGQPKAGVCGFSVSNLRIPDLPQPWEDQERRPNRICSALDIMLDAPVGAASFNNEFGRPNICGYFRTFETYQNRKDHWYGYHKPIMFAGGLGNIRRSQIRKRALKEDDLLIVLGGPSMLIGLGGGAASSLGQGRSDVELDFASVQRSNPEMQRRCQEVINRCSELNDDNPILSIHDVGAGGLSNAIPEIVHIDGLGARISLDRIPNDDPSMSPMENWCNEAQERYVLAIAPEELNRFTQICQRENCPFAMIGVVSSNPMLIVEGCDETKKNIELSVNIEMNFLMGGFSSSTFTDTIQPKKESDEILSGLNLSECIERVLRFPSVADKTFLVTIGDRTVTGLIHRDQMVGPWQVPVADSAVTLTGYEDVHGEAMAVGERTPLAVSNAPASARMAVCEALMNLRSASVSQLSTVKVCANWMADSKTQSELNNLYHSVQSVVFDICLKLGISIPVGKDSLSMFTEWQESSSASYRVRSPVSLIASAFAPVDDVRSSLTPQLSSLSGSKLLLIDLGCHKNRMGMSALYQTHNHYAGKVPDINSATEFSAFFHAVGSLLDKGILLAYHDRSDGGVFATLCEMAFAGRVGMNIQIDGGTDPIPYLFNEELGAVIQVRIQDLPQIYEEFESFGLRDLISEIGTVTDRNEIRIYVGKDLVYTNSRTALHRIWSELTWKMQSIRDNSLCAQQEYDRILDVDDPGLTPTTSFSFKNEEADVSSSLMMSKPKVAILREQGVNGQLEMAAAFIRAGFDTYDVMMSDLLAGEVELDRFDGMALCGGFSFGDVFGAGRGWAATILHNEHLSRQFASFFEDTSKFVLGVCNGCQVLAELKSIIPGAEAWPKIKRNQSEQFEARLLLVEVTLSRSIFTQGFQGSYLPVPVAHGEGRVLLADPEDLSRLEENGQICFRYVDNRQQATMKYPYNPNGSEGAIAGVTNLDGRITALMPHPERVFRTLQYSWAPKFSASQSPWLQLFKNAKYWLE